jgi:hypothetical protein
MAMLNNQRVRWWTFWRSQKHIENIGFQLGIELGIYSQFGNQHFFGMSPVGRKNWDIDPIPKVKDTRKATKMYQIHVISLLNHVFDGVQYEVVFLGEIFINKKAHNGVFRA